MGSANWEHNPEFVKYLLTLGEAWWDCHTNVY